ncbi:uncharacterized protein (DUF427 family) [Albidovulum inexpectatum]|uniref:Uncharacterized protein (DUF427 family) n=1 Tax=Albidovulum inexpectatum TaxID=196587 RepID=A0A2S5JIF4_9RHOB|nr:DUF427 domain-containing protein [Albidovulum inexpectatum]PPB81232.1 uncharacterized protein (DUF427 family) [Albidovulum inexpectatum]
MQITIRPAQGKWVVRAAGAIIGESDRALELIEADLPPVIYFPREDIAMAFLDRSDTVTFCPHKGSAVHFTVVGKSNRIEDAAWSYETPDQSVAAIAGHLAFYPDKVTIECL